LSTLTERIGANSELPFEVRKVFINAGEPEGWTAAWTNLWRECVARAVMDALGYTGQTEPDKHTAIQWEAERWFRYSKDLQEVFELADLPLKTTRDAVLANLPLTRKTTGGIKGTKRIRKQK
jgi:hypothetical protein